MLDSDLAKLYGVTTFNLNKAVRRNRERFPDDFMFTLRQEEYRSLRFQIGILKRGRHSKFLPQVFTQEGVAMLSGILRSETAVRVNIAIMRAFVRLRRALAGAPESTRLERVERKVDAHELELGEHEASLNEVFAAMRRGSKRLR